MSKYLFNVKAIVIDPKATGHGYDSHPVSIKAKSVEEALEKMREEYKRNMQFRFEYSYAGVVHEQ